MRNSIGNLSLRQLRAFDAVAQAGSFVGAARALHVTPSALTETIKQLEAALGARLIDRTTRALWLTPAGATFLETARESLRLLSQGMSRLREDASPAHGQVTVAAAQSVLASVVLPALPAVRSTYPHMAITLLDERGSGVVRAVASGAADFGVGGWHPDAQSLESEALFDDRLCVVGQADVALLRKRNLSGAHLKGQPFVGLTADTALHELVRGVETLPQAAREPVLRVSNTHLLQQAVRDGLGLALATALMARQPVFAGLAFRELHEPVVQRRIHLFTRPGRSLGPAALVVREAVMKAAARLPMGRGLVRA